MPQRGASEYFLVQRVMQQKLWSHCEHASEGRWRKNPTHGGPDSTGLTWLPSARFKLASPTMPAGEVATTSVIVDLIVTADTDKKKKEHNRPTTDPYMVVVHEAQQEHKRKRAKLDPDSKVDGDPEWTTTI